MIFEATWIRSASIPGRTESFMKTELRKYPHPSTGSVLVLAAALATLGQVVLAQDETVEASEDMEEIVVYGEKSQIVLRNELYRAQEDFFDVFNSLNSRDEFDIGCDFLTPLGERRRYHVCAPKFAVKAEADASARFLLSLQLASAQKEAPDFDAARSTAFPYDAQARRKEKQMWSEMETLLSEQPAMREALTKVTEAKDRYESARRKK